MANITVEWLGCPRGRGKHETMEFVYEETEETEGEMYQWCKGWGGRVTEGGGQGVSNSMHHHRVVRVSKMGWESVRLEFRYEETKETKGKAYQ